MVAAIFEVVTFKLNRINYAVFPRRWYREAVVS